MRDTSGELVNMLLTHREPFLGYIVAVMGTEVPDYESATNDFIEAGSDRR